MSRSVTVACVQLNSGASMDAAIAAIARRVAEAAARGAKLIALPENAFLMDAPAGGAPRRFFTEAQHPGLRAAGDMARQARAWLLAGSAAVRIDDSGKAVNRSLLFDPEGRIVARYDKIHLFDVRLAGGETYAESDRTLPGAQAVLAATPWGPLGLTICYDLRFPHLYRSLAKAGASVIAVPAAFTATTGEAHWHVLLRARAIETGCYIIAPAQTGTHPGGRRTYGHALIVDPWGTVLADAGTEPGVITAVLDLDAVARTRDRIPSLRHDRDYALPPEGAFPPTMR